jgi:hypothetical protein
MMKTGQVDSVIKDIAAIDDLLVRVMGANIGGAGAMGQVSGAPLVAASAGSRFARSIFNVSVRSARSAVFQ